MRLALLPDRGATQAGWGPAEAVGCVRGGDLCTGRGISLCREASIVIYGTRLLLETFGHGQPAVGTLEEHALFHISVHGSFCYAARMQPATMRCCWQTPVKKRY